MGYLVREENLKSICEVDEINEKIKYFERAVLENGEELKELIKNGVIEKGDDDQFIATIEVDRNIFNTDNN